MLVEWRIGRIVSVVVGSRRCSYIPFHHFRRLDMASAVTQPLLDTIEADDPTPTNAPSRGVNNSNTNANGAKPREPVVLMPGNSATAMGSQDLESGL